MIRKKLVKGSAAAKEFMSRLRSAKGKRKVTGVKHKPIYVTILGQRVKVGTKLHAKLIMQKKHFDDLQKHEIGGTNHTDNKSHNYKISISGLNGKRNNLLSDLRSRYGYLSTWLLTASKKEKNAITKEMREIRQEISQINKKIK